MSVTAPRGFRAAGVAAGLKSSGALDVALVVADAPCTAAAVLTSNKVQAAPVRWTRAVLGAGQPLRAVVLNSGGANACTGAAGLADTAQTAEAVAAHLGCDAQQVAVASTGLIGVRLPMERLLPGVAAAAAALSPTAGALAARAIMTTDSVPKETVTTAVLDGGVVTVGGMAKGAGMLAPSLATMLAVLTTDAQVAPEDLTDLLRQATSRTFDRLDSDGCQSTNDMVLLMASGASGVSCRPGEPGWERLTAAVHGACADLVAQLAEDAEGASKVIEVAVRGALSEDDALQAARAIARSALLKCAVHGEDPNWGRVLAALGAAGVEIDPDVVDVAMNGAEVCRAGVAGCPADEARLALAPRRVRIEVDLHLGSGAAEVLTNDLTAAYVHENSAYST